MLTNLVANHSPFRRRDSLCAPLIEKEVPMSAGSELWKECARWLRDLNILTADKNGTMLEFASVLRDGVLLCRLANALVPNSVDQKEIMKSQQQSQFTCFNNITHFVDVCRTHFQLPDSDLFSPGDLFHMTGFQKILKTLSILSNLDESIAKGVQPFPEIDQNRQGTSSSSPEFNDDEEIYQSLHDNIEKIDPDRTIYGPITSADPEEHQSEQLYDRIVTNRKPSLNESDLQNTPTLKRNRCIRELYDTEKNYVSHALVTIIKTFYEPLKKVIPTEAYEIIFGNIEDINTLHTALLEDLHWPVKVALGQTEGEVPPRPTSLSETPPQTIGEVFIKYRDQFLAYGKYCSNLPESRKLSNELLKSNETISKSIEELTAQGNCKFGMNDLLCVPFQRLTKYPLLLKELVKKTDLASTDRKSLNEAVEVMEDVCAYINEESRDTNSKKVIDGIEQSIVDLSMPRNVKLHDYGRVNQDGEIKMAESTHTQIGKPKQRYIFLFDKVIVICKAANKVINKDKSPGGTTKANTFTYKNAYVMSELSIDRNVSIDTKSGGTITRRTQYVIHMHRDRTDSSEIVQLTFYFKNEASRTNWLNALLLSKSNVSPTEYLRDTNHKVAFTSFRVDVKSPLVCDVCEKLMKGLRYQGYKCEACNMVMHKDCLGLKKCESRRSMHETRGSHSFNSNRPRYALREGDSVVATTNFTPSDLTYLQFQKGDRIEVIKIQSHNKFTGCLVHNRTRTGLVHADHITHVRATSMIGLSPLDSPAGSIVPRGVDRKESTVLPKRPETMLSDGSARSVGSQGTSRNSRNSSSSTLNGTEVARQQDYVNTEISEFLWYMGEMERAKAESTLRGTPNGTFLVRYSKNRKQTAISLSYRGEVKHMIIEQNSEGKVYLDEDYRFNSTVELVQYYRDHNLIEIFQALDTTLKNPFSQCKVFKAVHDYEAPPPNQDGKFLSLKTGDVVVLLDTVGEDRGWWKGQVNNKTGFFPLSYVKPYDASTEGPSIATSSNA
uniref:Protein vav-1 n=2 Tax=Caenorhabditis japonica TaxID=281687 RepID=A0A8R1HTU9_CAEJA